NGAAFPSVPAQKSITLKSHQRAAAEEIFSAYNKGYPGFLLADDVGLGKTFAAWAGILKIVESLHKKWKILIVCPLGVVANWRSSIHWMGTNGRSHRDGKFAQVYWVVAKDTVDGRVAEVLLWKLESMGNLQGDSTRDFEEILLT